MVALVTVACVLERKHANKADLELQQHHDPFETAPLSSKNAAFEEQPLKHTSETMPMGKWTGGAATYEQPNMYSTQQQQQQQQMMYFQLQQQYYDQQQQGQASMHFPQPPQPVYTTGAWS